MYTCMYVYIYIYIYTYVNTYDVHVRVCALSKTIRIMLAAFAFLLSRRPPSTWAGGRPTPPL